jgi:CBS domain-containing protein
MPITKKVRDIVVPLSEYAVTGAHQPLKDAVLTLRRVYCQVEDGKCTEAGHRSALVMDDKANLVGVLDFRSILKVLIPEIAGGLSTKLESLGVTMAFAQADALELDEARISFRARVVKNAETRVGEVMLKVRGTISADADLLDALRLIYTNRIHMLPVFDGDKLIGVIRDSDLFLAVSDIFKEE